MAWYGVPYGPWITVEPFQNGYDARRTDNLADCMFDPDDDGNNEDSYFDPADRGRRLGPSSTCHTARVFGFQGDTRYTGTFDATRVGRAGDGPGLLGSIDRGTGVETKINLQRFAGRTIRFRFLVTTIKYDNSDVVDYLSRGGPFFPGMEEDAGWYIDNIHVDSALISPSTLSEDDRDNSAAPAPDTDADGFAGCQDCDDGDNQIRPGGPQLCDGQNNDCGDPSRPTVPLNETDSDRDGYVARAPWVGTTPGTLGGGDCIGDDPTSHPGALEICDNKDNDCNGTVDDGWATPGTTPGLGLASDKHTMNWSVEPQADGYDVTKDNLTALRSGGGFVSPVPGCVENDSVDTQSDDLVAPPVGSPFYYLVHSKRACGNGTYNSGAATRSGNRDSGIGASPNRCP